MKIGVLAVQGGFAEHLTLLKKHKVQAFEIRSKKDLEQDFDGLILPGGESTVMGKLLTELDMFHLLQKKIRGNLPIFGTCAGLILLAKSLEQGEEPCLAAMNIKVQRNGYGRQLGSFSTIAPMNGLGEVPMVFIRAPYITEAKESVEILSTVNGNIVAAKEKNLLVTAFHPELTEEFGVHSYFLDMVAAAKRTS